jgi:hypothetical protein
VKIVKQSPVSYIRKFNFVVLVNEAPRPHKGGASRQGNLIYIVPLDPADKAGLAGHVPADILEHYT